MAIKRKNPINTLQQRIALQRALNTPNLGRISRVNPQRNIRELERKLIERERKKQMELEKSQQQKAIKQLQQQKSVSSEEIEFQNRVKTGRLTPQEFQKTTIYQTIIKKFGPRAGQDIATATYIDYLEEFRGPLTKDELLQRASALRTAGSEIERRQKERILSTPRGRERLIQQEQAGENLRREILKETLKGNVVNIPALREFLGGGRSSQQIVSRGPTRFTPVPFNISSLSQDFGLATPANASPFTPANLKSPLNQTPRTFRNSFNLRNFYTPGFFTPVPSKNFSSLFKRR